MDNNILDSERANEYAAIDLGSNSFHMVVARHDEHGLTILDRVREMVRMGSGLDQNNHLTETARERALECLSRFGQRLRGLSSDNVRIVGTNTLRKAKNSKFFIHEAEAELGFVIEIISGVEEARLIYQGVSETLQEDLGRRLVVDIGGGSTEMIVGDAMLPKYLESLYMGCVSTSQRFFSSGKLSAPRMRKAIMAASLELEPHILIFKTLSWVDAIGTSGTARSIERVIRESGWSEGGITRAGMEQLVDAVVEAGHIDNLKLSGLGERRQPVFAGGVAVMAAIFRALNIEHMRISDGSLREGVLMDLIGRQQSRDTRTETVDEVMKRHHVDAAQAERVRETAEYLFKQVSKDWGLAKRDGQLLAWAARLHEVGLLIAHNQYHKHGAYMLENMDLPGFSRQEQTALSILVRLHRRKFQLAVLDSCANDGMDIMHRLAILLRLSVLFNRSRSGDNLPAIIVSVSEMKISLLLESSWLEKHALTKADLKQEKKSLKQSGIRLSIKTMD